MTSREKRPVGVAAIPMDGFTSDLVEGLAAQYAYERAERDAAMAAALSAQWAGYEPKN